MTEQSSHQSELLNIIRNQVEQNNTFYRELFKDKNQSVISLFRSLPSTTRQLLIRVIYLGQSSIEFYEVQCQKAEHHFKPIQVLGLGQCRKLNDKDPQQITLNLEFCEGVREVIDGHSKPCFLLSGQKPTYETDTIEQWKMQCQFKWKTLFNAISQSQSINHEYSNRIMQTLQNSQLLKQNSDIGFQFILTSTRQQINMLIGNYVQQMIEISKRPVDVIRFILELSVLNPYQMYQIDPSRMPQLELDILEDFSQLGFIFRGDTKEQIRISFLLWNFLYEEPCVSIDIRCNIIVEANFRIYAYIESKDLVEENILFNLLSLFADIKYRFPNLIIGDLNQGSVLKAYKRNLKAEQIIQFLEINNRNPQQHQSIESVAQKNNLKENSQQEMKKRLSFLRVFQNETMISNPILPHNVVQQLRFWEQEAKDAR